MTENDTPNSPDENLNETETPHTEQQGDPGDQQTADGVAAETTADAGTPEPVSLEDQITDLNDKLLRALAELENTRRRAERDRAEAQQYGMMRFARDMLSVSDNFGRALSSLSDEIRAELPEAVTAVLEGIDATERELTATFERHSIIRVSPMGEKFDPNLHEAMFEAPGTGAAAGTVIEVIEPGYRIGERLLRPARVGVAKD